MAVGRLTWLLELDHPEKIATIVTPPMLYSGNARIALLFLALKKALGEVNAETGCMIDAVGVGASLLHLILSEKGRCAAALFLDNPFLTGLAQGGKKRSPPHFRRKSLLVRLAEV